MTARKPRSAAKTEEQQPDRLAPPMWSAALALVTATVVIARLVSTHGGDDGAISGDSLGRKTTTVGQHIEAAGDTPTHLTWRSALMEPRPVVEIGDRSQVMGGMAELYRERSVRAELVLELEARMGGMAELYREQQLARSAGSVGHGP